MSGNSFFQESRPQSKVKTKIVTEYFFAWTRVMIGTARKRGKIDRIAYIDLYSGPGYYEDGTPSTPILILEKAIQDIDLQRMLVTVFNDIDPAHCQRLKKAVNSIPGISCLQHKPDISNEEVNDGLVRFFDELNLVPSLIFIDPWGYKGLSCQLINSTIKNWGCDCIFFFNYNRINMGISNPSFDRHMNALFGNDRTKKLQTQAKGMQPPDREKMVISEFMLAVQENGFKYVLPFCFKDKEGTQTSHYLIFVSKDPLGYDIMKGIMAKYSSWDEQGVPSFEYTPRKDRQLGFEFFRPRPLDSLEEMLLNEFAGQTLEMQEVYSRHNVGTRYIKKNYKDVLLKLEEKGEIMVSLPPNKKSRRKGTFADGIIITFPSQR